LAFHLGTGLARFFGETRVLLIDVDHQSSLSIVCLGGATRWEAASTAGETVDQVFQHFTGAVTTLPGPEIVVRNPIRGNRYPSLDLVPASLHLDDTEIELAGTHKGNPITSEWDKRTLLCRWIEENGIDEEYDYIIFDCPPATKIVSQNALAASHGYIVPVVPEAVMERGAPHLVEMIGTGIDRRLNALAQFGNPSTIYAPNTELVGLVITRIRTHRGSSGYTDDHTTHLYRLERTWGDRLINPYIEDGTGVSQSLAAGLPVYDRTNTQNVRDRGFDQMFRQLVTTLKSRIDQI
jgi:chromosome partitioning protein